MTRTFEILVEPRGAAYLALLDLAEGEGSTFSLVWRHQLSFAPGALKVRERLESSLICEESTSAWPGTELLNSVARVGHYRFDPASRAVLAEAKGLYSWLAPDLPEDLALYKDGTCWLTSIAHEAEAWIETEVLASNLVEILQTTFTGRVRGGGEGRADRKRGVR